MSKDPWDAIDAGLVKASGRSLDEWVAEARSSGHDRHKSLVDWLKAERGLTHGYANSIALRTFKSDAGSMSEEQLMDGMFAGPKAALKPIHARLAAFVRSLGDDVELAPKKAYVSARRSKQFAILQPSTRDRYDLGLNLKGVEPAGRLEASGSFNAMCSHRVRLAAADEVDDEVEGWIRQAYERA